MRERFCVFVLIVVLVGVLATAACAQYQSSDKSYFGIGFSVYTPSNSNLSTLSGAWFGPTLEAHLSFDKLDRTTTVFTAGWFGESNNYASAGLVPITVTFLKRFSNNPDKPTFYVGGGPGLYFGNFKVYDPYTGGAISSNQTGLGLNMVAGDEFGAWFAQIRYDVVGSMTNPIAGSVDFSGLSFVLGSRIAL